MSGQKKKIVVDGAIFGLQKAGGISRLFADLVCYLDSCPEYKLFVLLPKNSNVEWRAIEGCLKNTTLHKRPRYRQGIVRKFMNTLYLTLMALRVRPLIWHASYYVGFPLWKGGKKVVTFHDMIGEVMGIATNSQTQEKYAALRASTQIAAISHFSKKDLLSFWPEFAHKVQVIPNGLRVASPKKQEADSYFIFIGKRSGYKNFLPCIHALLQEASFKKYSIKVVGGEETLSQQERELPQERVSFLGILPHEQVQRLLSGAAALLFPSLYEGFGYPLLEAFFHEVPVLAMQRSCLMEVAGEYPLAKDNSAFIDTLKELLQNKARWVAYGKERAQLFSLEKMVDAYCRLYEI